MGRKNSSREFAGVRTIDFPLSCGQGFPAPYFLQVICSCVPFPECLLGTRCQAPRCKVAASCSLFKHGDLFIHVVPSVFSPSLPVAFPYGTPLTPVATVVLYYGVCTFIGACLVLGHGPVPFPCMLSLPILTNFSSSYLNLFVLFGDSSRSTMVLFLSGSGVIQ